MFTTNPTDSLASRILHLQGLGELRTLGHEWVSGGELAAFEIRVYPSHSPGQPMGEQRNAASQGADELALLTSGGEVLPPMVHIPSPLAPVCEEGDGTWAFPLGAEDSPGWLRVRFAHAPDAAQLERFQSMGKNLQSPVRYILAQNRLRDLERSVGLLQEQARHAERLKEEFLSNLSHELRTPLTAMLGFAEILMERQEVQPENRACVDRIRDNGERLLVLLNRLIHLAKLQADRAHVFIVPGDLGALVTEAAKRIQSAAGAKSLQVNCAVDAMALETDPKLVAQVLDCVLENAVKFTDFGTISIHASADAEQARIQITDTGRGIDTRSLPFVFDAFWQGDGSMTRAVGGNGIGLALASRLVHRLGGTITLDSERGQGTRVLITLPRTADHPVAPRLGPRKAPEQQYGLPF